MMDVLFAATNFLNQCQYNISFLNYDGWIPITVLVVLISMLIAGVVYGMSGFLPTATRERLRGVAKYEYVQAIFSIILIVVLFGMSITACDVGGILTSSSGNPQTNSGYLLGPTGTLCANSYQDPFQFSNCYVGNLLFSKGTALVTGLFSAGTILIIDAQLVSLFVSETGQLIPLKSPIGSSSLSVTPKIGISGTDTPTEVIYEYSFILNSILAPVVVVSFGLLFVVFLMLPVVEMLSLTLIVPVAIIMRSLAFTGPRLREVSNALIALAIAFYFVFPLTLAMDYYIVNWVYCINGGACNPYASPYLNPGYTLNTLPINNLFTNPDLINTQSTSGYGALTNVPLNFYGAVIAGNGGWLNVAEEIGQGFLSIPNLINNFVTETAQYIFQSIFLIALDAGITIGFAMGLHKGLESMGQLLGIGPFWSG